MSDTETLIKTITDLQEALDKAQRELEEVEKDNGGPNTKDKYWIVCACGTLYEWYWSDDVVNKKHVKMNNIFRTQEEAEHYRDWLKSPVTQARYKLQYLADKYNEGWVRKIGERGCYHYLGIPNIEIDWNGDKAISVIYFKRKEDCLGAIKLLGEDLIKTALGVMK